MAPSARLLAFAFLSVPLAVPLAAPLAAPSLPSLLSLSSLVPSISSLPLTWAALSLSPIPSLPSLPSLAALPSLPDHSTASKPLLLRFWRFAGSPMTWEALKPCLTSWEAAVKAEMTSVIA